MKGDQYKSDYEKENLSWAKLTNKKIVDIVGYLTGEFGEATFKVSRIVYEDGSHDWVEGEHDLPYITGETVVDLQELYDEENEEDNEE